MFQSVAKNTSCGYFNILLKTGKFLAISNFSYDKSKQLFTYSNNIVCSLPILLSTFAVSLIVVHEMFMKNNLSKAIKIEESITLISCMLNLYSKMVLYYLNSNKFTQMLNNHLLTNFAINLDVVAVLFTSSMNFIIFCTNVLMNSLKEPSFVILIKMFSMLSIIIETIIIGIILNEVNQQIDESYKNLIRNRKYLVEEISNLVNEQYRFNQSANLAKKVFRTSVLLNTLSILCMLIGETYFIVMFLRRINNVGKLTAVSIIFFNVTIVLTLKIQINSWISTTNKVSSFFCYSSFLPLIWSYAF